MELSALQIERKRGLLACSANVIFCLMSPFFAVCVNKHELLVRQLKKSFRRIVQRTAVNPALLRLIDRRLPEVFTFDAV